MAGWSRKRDAYHNETSNAKGLAAGVWSWHSWIYPHSACASRSSGPSVSVDIRGSGTLGYSCIRVAENVPNTLRCAKWITSQGALSNVHMDKNSVPKAARKASSALQEMVAATLKPDLTPNQRVSLETCITVHIHQKVRNRCIITVYMAYKFLRDTQLDVYSYRRR